MIFLRRQVSHATTTLLRFFAFGSEELASSSPLVLEVEGFASDAALGRFFAAADAPEGDEDVLQGPAAVCGDKTFFALAVAEVAAAPKVALDAGAGELSKETLERPLRIDTSSNAA